MSASIRRVRGLRLEAGARRDTVDRLAVEEPLEIRVGDGREVLRRVVTMRTPGADIDLALGWLRSEGVVRRPGDIVAARECADPALGDDERHNVITVDLAQDAIPRLDGVERSSTVSSACGVCGAESLRRVRDLGFPAVDAVATIDASTLLDLTERLAEGQRMFRTTGGIHGAAACDASGRLLALREDVGRHNAADKILGWSLVAQQQPAALVVTSRASYDIVQKAVAGGIPVVVTVSAPSSLAVDLAQDAGVTLVAFARESRATVYSHPHRIA